MHHVVSSRNSAFVSWAPLVGMTLAVCACDSGAKQSGSHSAVVSTGGPEVSAKPRVEANQQDKKLAPPTTKCPAGRWRYDYSDQALELMTKNIANAKVLKEEGEFVCEIPEGPSGVITCDTQGRPVENVVEAKQAGMPMTVSVKFEGIAATKFKRLDSGRWLIESSDNSQFKLQTRISIGGRSIPFPGEQLLDVFGEKDAILQYKCEGGKLHLKPTLEGIETSWQELNPAE